MTVVVLAAGCSGNDRAATQTTTPIRPATEVVATVAMPSMPGGIAVDPATHKIYVATPEDNAIQVVDPESRKIVGVITSATHPVLLQIDPAKNRLYSANYAETNGDGGSVELIDLGTAQVTATIPVGNRPLLAVDTAADVAYSISAKDFTLSVIDPEQAVVTSTAAPPPGQLTGVSAITVDPANHTLYAADEVQHLVAAVDPNTGTATPVADVGDQPGAVGVDPSTHLIYTLDYGTGRGAVSVVDPTTHQKIANLPAGDGPTDIAIDAAGHLAYVTNNGGSVSVLDLASRSLVSDVRAGQAPTAVAVDPQTHTVYVGNVGDKTISVIAPLGNR
ncbi:MAG: YncE family protein [Mycobacterium sp.]